MWNILWKRCGKINQTEIDNSCENCLFYDGTIDKKLMVCYNDNIALLD